jgi:hypothetical protein
VTDQNKKSTDDNKKKKQRARSKNRTNSNQPQQKSGDQQFNQKLRELVKKYKGFDPWEKEHKAHSDIERKICRYLDDNGLEHKHGGKRYNVVFADRRTAVFEPDIVVPHPRIQGKPILIQAVHSGNHQTIVPVLEAFRRQLGEKYYIVVVTRKDNLTNVSADVCDLLVAVEYASSLPSQLRSQAG